MINLINQKPTVFITGSAKIKQLSESMKVCLDGLIIRDVHIVIGDCYGVDILAQKYLKKKGFNDVTVYCSTETPRRCEFPNFISMWKESQGKEGAEFFEVKDKEMCQICTEAVAFWNGTSHGVKRNIDHVRSLGKHVTVIKEDICDLRDALVNKVAVPCDSYETEKYYIFTSIGDPFGEYHRIPCSRLLVGVSQEGIPYVCTQENIDFDMPGLNIALNKSVPIEDAGLFYTKKMEKLCQSMAQGLVPLLEITGTPVPTEITQILDDVKK